VVSQASYYDYQQVDGKSSGLAANPDGSLFVLGTFELAGDSWPYALTRLVNYSPPTLTSLGYSATSGSRFSANLVEGQPYRLQVSTNRRDWYDLMRLTGSASPLVVGDLVAKTLPRRFYRLAVP